MRARQNYLFVAFTVIPRWRPHFWSREFNWIVFLAIEGGFTTHRPRGQGDPRTPRPPGKCWTGRRGSGRRGKRVEAADAPAGPYGVIGGGSGVGWLPCRGGVGSGGKSPQVSPAVVAVAWVV